MTSGTPLPAPLPTCGFLYDQVLRAEKLLYQGGHLEALTIAERWETVAEHLGDASTARQLSQIRLHARLSVDHASAPAGHGHDVLARQQAAGDRTGEAQTLATLAEHAISTGRFTDAMRHLARARLLLDHSARSNPRYGPALAAYGLAAQTASLYEVAAEAWEELWQHPHRFPHDTAIVAHRYADVLLLWGIRLRQLDHPRRGEQKLREAAAVAGAWLQRNPGHPDCPALFAVLALALAALGDTDQAEALAGRAVMPLRTAQRHRQALRAHLALALALRGRDDVAAHRELLAARQLCAPDWTEEQLIIRHETATLTARGGGVEGDLLETIHHQDQQLWQRRLQRLAMLQQARQHEELAVDRARTHATLRTDPLTGLGNRRRFDELLAAIDQARVPLPLSLLVIDIDDFKSLNDTHSHSVGDQVLREVAAAMTATCRHDDTVIRYAGDEFTIAVNDDLGGAIALAERIRRAISARDLSRIAPGTPVRISTGVAMLRPGMNAAELFHAADTNLYHAKRAGRDRVAA